MKNIKNKKIILRTIFGISASTIVIGSAFIVPLVIQNKTNTVNNNVNMDKKLTYSFDNLFNNDAEERITNLLFSNHNQRINQNITKEEIKNNIYFNKDTYLYQEINKLNPNLSSVDDELATEIYEMYQNEKEYFEQDTNAKCGSIFKKHFWIAVSMKARALLINGLSMLWWAMQLVPAISSFVTTLNGAALADAFASFDFKLPDFFQKCLVSTVKTIKQFKTQTRCFWKFKIWTQGIYI